MIKHLLIIRLSALGDVAMTVPAVRALAIQHPDLKITILSRDFFKPLFQDIPNVSFYAADVKGKHKGVLGLKKLSSELKKLEVDAVADLHSVLRSNILKLFFKLSGIPVVQIDKGRKEKKQLVEGKIFQQLKTTHQRYLDVFQQLGFDVSYTSESLSPKSAIPQKALDILKEKKEKWIGIAPHAAFEGKMYPLDLMEKVIASLNDKEGVKTLLFGGPEDKRVLDSLAQKYHHVESMVGKLSFEEELQLISNLDIMLSMDSGNAHLASVFGVKTITLWGVTHPYAGFYPFDQSPKYALLADRNQFPLIPTSIYGNKFPEGYENAMRTIQPAAVVEKVVDVLEA
ncbi:glycosyltransferase family 9 protein [Flammeovirgaceae bacterium SG7u.111]|nr:glycosyltransferase family 9 protein [Flammeovirgaceae bacterium SG7u.132]WPO36668.1 glycosyltransferase family 9 protein [Flammeovirgaceae bacterium SG7u.111]